MRHTKKAFHWIIRILRNRHIPFQIDGGLAAKTYGSNRKLADIDIVIPTRKFNELVPLVKNYIIYGPRKYIDRNWNLLLITLNYKDQLIDLCGDASTKIFDKNKGKWIDLKTSFNKTTKKKIFDIFVPVRPKRELVDYKRKLLRRVDRADLKFIEKSVKT